MLVQQLLFLGLDRKSDSNRLVIKKDTGKIFVSKLRLAKKAYAEILSQVNSFPYEGHLTSSNEASSGCDWYVCSLKIDGKTYYTSLDDKDESIYNIIVVLSKYIEPLYGCANNSQGITNLPIGISHNEAIENIVIEDGDTPDMPQPPVTAPQIKSLPLSKACKYFAVNYVYLTDSSEAAPITLVQEGDTYLGWHVNSIDARFEQYDDGSIAYNYIEVYLIGEAEVTVDLEYILECVDEIEISKGLYATVKEGSLPVWPMYHNPDYPDPRVYFELCVKEGEFEQFIEEYFCGSPGTIENCTLSVERFA